MYTRQSAGTSNDVLNSLSFVARFGCINPHTHHSVADFTIARMLEREISVYLLKERRNLGRRMKFGGVIKTRPSASTPHLLMLNSRDTLFM